MQPLKKNEKLTLLYIIGWLLVILVQYLRANTQHGGALTVVYGVAPNFILGFCAPSLFLLFRARAVRRFPGLSDLGWFCLSVALGVGAVVAWELFQPLTANLVFDGADIVATLLGGFLFLGCWPLVRKHLAAV